MNTKFKSKTNFINDNNKENIQSNNLNGDKTIMPKYQHQHLKTSDTQHKRNHANQVKKSPNKKDFLKNVTIKKDNKELEKRKIIELYNQKKLNPHNFHSSDTFEKFLNSTLNLTDDVTNEILTNQKVQYWIERNRQNGFVYQTYPHQPAITNETAPNESPTKPCINTETKRLLPVRCDLCKFYGHLSHTCSIKEVLRNGACRCHICGMLGHPAEAGLCPYISCSFCSQNGHWNFMCPNKDKVSRTFCHRCQKYGHKTESCPDQWRQFDRISSYEQTPYRDTHRIKKAVYCYQCAQKGHYGHNCPEFHRKYFIRDYHHLDNNPIYFFASVSPFVKTPAKLNDQDKEIIQNLVDAPIDVKYKEYTQEQVESFWESQEKERNNSQHDVLPPDSHEDEEENEDKLKKLEKFQQSQLTKPTTDTTSILFNESHTNIPLKEYIRKWSNWVMDFHWVFTLKFFIDSLPTYKLYNFIKYYPTLDNFILHWMWWSYTLSKDLERFTNDPFCAAGTMPWLIDSKNKKQVTNEIEPQDEQKTIKIPPSKYVQYSESTIKFINSLLFPSESSKTNTNQTANVVNDSKANSITNRTKSFNVNPDLNGNLKPAPMTSIAVTKTPTVSDTSPVMTKRLQRSQSCNVLLDTKPEVHQQQKSSSSSKRKSISKSTTSSPYINGKGKLGKAAQTMSTNSKSLKLTYVNDIYQLKSNEFTDSLLQRLDSYCNFKTINTFQATQQVSTLAESDVITSSLENLVDLVTGDCTTTSPSSSSSSSSSGSSTEESDTHKENNKNENDQDRTIVFELGCCNFDNENDVLGSAQKNNLDMVIQENKKVQNHEALNNEHKPPQQQQENSNVKSIFEKLFINTNTTEQVNQLQQLPSCNSISDSLTSTTKLLKLLLKINTDEKPNDAKPVHSNSGSSDGGNSQSTIVKLDANENLIRTEPLVKCVKKPLQPIEVPKNGTTHNTNNLLKKKSSSINDLKIPGYVKQQHVGSNKNSSFQSTHNSNQCYQQQPLVNRTNSFNYASNGNRSFQSSFNQTQPPAHSHHHHVHLNQSLSYQYGNMQSTGAYRDYRQKENYRQNSFSSHSVNQYNTHLSQTHNATSGSQHKTKPITTTRVTTTSSNYTTSSSSSSAVSSLKHSPVDESLLFSTSSTSSTSTTAFFSNSSKTNKQSLKNNKNLNNFQQRNLNNVGSKYHN